MTGYEPIPRCLTPGERNGPEHCRGFVGESTAGHLLAGLAIRDAAAHGFSATIDATDGSNRGS